MATVWGLGGGGWFAEQAGSRWPDGAGRLPGRRWPWRSPWQGCGWSWWRCL